MSGWVDEEKKNYSFFWSCYTDKHGNRTSSFVYVLIYSFQQISWCFRTFLHRVLYIVGGLFGIHFFNAPILLILIITAIASFFCNDGESYCIRFCIFLIFFFSSCWIPVLHALNVCIQRTLFRG